jgi:AcrR family transcriptional regulator
MAKSLPSLGQAGVTRLTFYNQFGSRSALLEAVFDERAARGGLHRIAGAMAASDPHAGLLQVIAIFLRFLELRSPCSWAPSRCGRE